MLDVVVELVPEVPDEARTGIAAASPSAQMVWPSIFARDVVEQIQVFRPPFPFTMRWSTRYIQPVPSRQGVHWPQDSA